MFRPRALAIAVLLPLWAATVSAQSPQTGRSDRPYRGLFGQSTEPVPGHQVVVTGILLTGYDDDLRADARGTGGGGGTGVSSPDEALSGSVTTAMGSMSYTFTNDSLAVSLMGGGVARYYPSLEDEFVPYPNASGSVNYSTALRKGLTVSMNAAAFYRPYLFDSTFLFPSSFDLPDPALGDDDVPYDTQAFLTHTERIGLSQRLTQRTTLHGFVGYRGTEKAESRADRPFSRQSYGGGLTHNLSQGLSLRAGYTLHETHYSLGRVIPFHVIDVGANYGRALSFSRRTTLSFGTGTTALERNDELRWRLTGQAQLTHEFGRTWTAYASYHRSVLSSEVWDAPADADGVAIGLAGLFTRRLQMSATARGVLGKAGQVEDPPGFDGLHGELMFGYALNRWANLTAMYAYYQHNFDAGTPLRVDLPRTVERNSVRVGVTLSKPIYHSASNQSARRNDASR
jgi:hypothetical protein